MSTVFKKQKQQIVEKEKPTLQQQITAIEARLKEMHHRNLQQVVAIQKDNSSIRQDIEILIDSVRALVELVGIQEVNDKVEENQVKAKSARDEARREHMLQLIEQKRIEEEEFVRDVTPKSEEVPAGDIGSYVSSVEFAPDAPEDAEPIPGSHNFMPMAMMQPRNVALQMVGKRAGDEIEVPWTGPEEKKPQKLGRILILGIFKALPAPQKAPEPEVPANEVSEPPALPANPGQE